MNATGSADGTSAAIASALDHVGPRLRQVRTQRRMTLTGVAERPASPRAPCPGSRPGSGGRPWSCSWRSRRPTGCRSTTSSGAPAVGDPRIRLKPGRVKGRTVIPLTLQPDGMQAWKIVIQTSKVIPEPRAHDGHEWIYVLSGHLRLVLGDRDRVLGADEVAEFDTKVPHWFGSTGEQAAEILSIFSRPGERMTVQTTPIQAETPTQTE
jgi:quercetin dioxygenase-like cupin family protein